MKCLIITGTILCTVCARVSIVGDNQKVEGEIGGSTATIPLVITAERLSQTVSLTSTDRDSNRRGKFHLLS